MVINHQFAGITVQTRSDVLIRYLVGRAFGKFLVSCDKPDISCRINQFNPNSLNLSPLVAEETECLTRSIGFPKEWLAKSVLRFQEVRNILRECTGHPDWVHVDPRWNRVIIRDYATNVLDILYPSERIEDFAGPLFEAGYRNLLAAFMPNFSSVLIHGAGLLRNNMATLFLAADEGGKTSVVDLADGAAVLSDDNLILRRVNEVITAYGTPFGARTSGPQKAKLGGIFLLEKSAHFDLTPVKASGILQFLWHEHMHLWFVLPKSLRLRAFNLLYDACHQAPCYRMRFPKDYVDWDAIDAAMK